MAKTHSDSLLHLNIKAMACLANWGDSFLKKNPLLTQILSTRVNRRVPGKKGGTRKYGCRLSICIKFNRKSNATEWVTSSWLPHALQAQTATHTLLPKRCLASCFFIQSLSKYSSPSTQITYMGRLPPNPVPLHRWQNGAEYLPRGHDRDMNW